MTSYCQYTPDKKEQSTQNQTKICAIIVFYVYFVLYIELLFGDVGLNGSLNKQVGFKYYGDAINGTVKVDIGEGCAFVIIKNLAYAIGGVYFIQYKHDGTIKVDVIVKGDYVTITNEGKNVVFTCGNATCKIYACTF